VTYGADWAILGANAWDPESSMIFKLQEGRLGRCLGFVDVYLRVVCGAVKGDLGDLGLERVRILRASWGGSLLPLVLALQSLLAVLGLLDAFHVNYFPMIHRATVTRAFSLGFSLAPVLLLLSFIIIVYLLMGGRYWAVLILSSVSLGLYLVSRIWVSVSVLYVTLVAVPMSPRMGL